MVRAKSFNGSFIIGAKPFSGSFIISAESSGCLLMIRAKLFNGGCHH